MSLDLGDSSALKLSHNRPEIIRQEILDTNIIRLIEKNCGLSDKERATIKLVPTFDAPHMSSSETEIAELYQIGPDERAFDIFFERLRGYIEARQAGHTKQFLMEAFTNRVLVSSLSDADLRALVANRPLVPASWLRKGDSYSVTNELGHAAGWAVPGEVCRWVHFTLTDSSIGWRYELCFKADGRLAYIGETKSDAKEFDPKYKSVIQEAEINVRAEMSRDGTVGRSGSCHTFWRLKKEKLKAKGVEWRSPAELNPRTIYD